MRIYELRWWRLIHLSLSLSIPIVLVVMGACSEDFEESPPTTGQEVSTQEVQDVLNQALEGVNPAEAPVGAAVLYEMNYRIETGAAEVMEETLTQLLEKSHSSDVTRLLLREIKVDYTLEEPDRTEREVIIDVDQPRAPELLSTLKAQQNLMLKVGLGQLPVRRLIAQQDNRVVRTTFHELETEPFEIDSPGDCGSLRDCKVRGLEVSFSLIQWFANGEFEKTRFLYRLTKDIPVIHHLYSYNPFNASALAACQLGKINFEGRKLLVNQCLVLRDMLLP